MMTALTVVSFALALGGPQPCPLHPRDSAAVTPDRSPYAGEEGREIKALSEADVRAYLDGTGMGMARAAELNQYPGPRHVLDNAETLKLSPAQRVAIDAVHQRMKAAAAPLGRQVVDVERRLDALFARREATADAIERLTREAADLQGRLRTVHLRAHVEVRPLLTPDQIMQYVGLRGYSHGGH